MAASSPGMEPERLRAVTSLVGRVAHRSGAAHRCNVQEAREGGSKGGIAASRAAAKSRRSAPAAARRAAF